MKIFILIMILGFLIIGTIFIYSNYLKEKSIFDEVRIPMPLYKK